MLSPQFVADTIATCRSRPRLGSRIALEIVAFQAIAKNAYGSAAMEGNPTPLWRVEEIVAPLLERRILELIRDELEAEQAG